LDSEGIASHTIFLHKAQKDDYQEMVILGDVMKVYIHLVFCTKYRYDYFNVENIAQLRVMFQTDYLKNTFEIVEAGGHKNHIHILIRMEKTESLPSIIHAIKGPTSRWINKHGLCKKTFRWAVGYYAARVSEEALPRVIKYIQNQEAHHNSSPGQQPGVCG
jgi:REP element-mobilizing transposase RayT